jgi:hypothetical protein
MKLAMILSFIVQGKILFVECMVFFDKFFSEENHLARSVLYQCVKYQVYNSNA